METSYSAHHHIYSTSRSSINFPLMSVMAFTIPSNQICIHIQLYGGLELPCSSTEAKTPFINKTLNRCLVLQYAIPSTCPFWHPILSCNEEVTLMHQEHGFPLVHAWFNSRLIIYIHVCSLFHLQQSYGLKMRQDNLWSHHISMTSCL